MQDKSKSTSFFSNVLNYIVVIGVVVLIAFLFPYKSGQQYEYEIGRPWVYDNLVAQTSFGILKSKEQLEEEKEQIREEFNPYYTLDTSLLEKSINSFDQKFKNLRDELSQSEQGDNLVDNATPYINISHDLLNQIYNQGVLDTSAMHNAYDPEEYINIIEGNSKRTVALKQLFTIPKAKAYIQQELRKSNLAAAEYILPVLQNEIKANLNYDPERSQRYLEMKLSEVSPTKGVVQANETIVKTGQIVTPEIARKIESYESQYNPSLGKRLGSWWVFAGYLLLTIGLIGIFLFYLQLNAPEVYSRFNNLLFMILWVALYSYLVSVIDPIDNISIYIIPFCIVPIVIKNFFNDRLALFVHLIIILLASYLSNLGYEFMFIEIVAGIATILSLRIKTMWNRIFTTVAIIFLSYAVSFTGLSLIREGSFSTIMYSHYLWFFLSAFLTFLAYPLLPLLERAFRFTSDITLSELADMNHPLLKKLSVEAPGTLQHSLQVSNLSEAAADEVGANALLLKVGALFHDVGKLKNPEYFIENQSGNNPHEDINNLESARIIIDHVPEGAKLAKQHRLPKLIIDFIWTHHGTTRVEYFYRMHQNNHPDQEVDDAPFRYPGPKPSTKEHAILMLADSLEATCRALKSPTGKELDETINKIIDSKIDGGQLTESDLTFEELEICKRIFRKMLRSIHHVRVEYPEEQKTTEE
jgi:hypothetical protein